MSLLLLPRADCRPARRGGCSTTCLTTVRRRVSRRRACVTRLTRQRTLSAGADAPTAGARFPSSKLKLDELFLGWLSLPESQKLVRSAARAAPRGPRTSGARLRFVTRAPPRQVLALLDDAKAGRPIGGPTATRAPLSPSAAASLHTASTAMARDPRPSLLPGCASPAFRAIQRASCRSCASAPQSAPQSRGALAGRHITPTDASRVHAHRQPPLSPQKGSGHRHPLLDSGSPPMSPRSRSAAMQSVSSAAAAAAKHRATVPQFYFPQARSLFRSPACGPSLTRSLRTAPRAQPRARRRDGKQDQRAFCFRRKQRHAARSFCRRGSRGARRGHDCARRLSAR